ncbi:MAG: hypothetical protein KH032_07365 [[Clostridium] spiroforme]|uniref:hypothetical protein n=1 Tax=Thomasclavelia spiroformis TaxID=29348 RepID=UPI001D40706D|nr:hypothetical protein [Thomasclavelia spiroformis]MBS7217051.1 hypothetical protein [Thomasclavelia spiroformis]
MRKNFGVKPWFYPLPVLIVGSYDENGQIDVDKLQPIAFDPVKNDYRVIGEKVGNAFEDGNKLK